MRCLACQFENPGQRVECYRCAHPLDLSHVCVEPPRASGAGRVWFSLWPQRAIHRFGRRVRAVRVPPFLAWTISFVPGLGHLLLGRRAWALGLGLAWMVACVFEGEVTLRPRSLVMLVQCAAMTEAYRMAHGGKVPWEKMIALSLMTSALLAVVEMIFIGGILW